MSADELDTASQFTDADLAEIISVYEGGEFPVITSRWVVELAREVQAARAAGGVQPAPGAECCRATLRSAADELDRYVAKPTGTAATDFLRVLAGDEPCQHLQDTWGRCNVPRCPNSAGRAAGGVQPAPAAGWVVVAVLPRGKYDVRENPDGWAVHIFDEQTAGMLAAGSGSTDQPPAEVCRCVRNLPGRDVDTGVMFCQYCDQPIAGGSTDGAGTPADHIAIFDGDPR